MRICIESSTLNHNRRSGLMTYTEGLVYGLFDNDIMNNYILAFYSLHRLCHQMPGPEGKKFSKKVLRLPDWGFFQRQVLIDRITLPLFLKSQKVKVFHRPAGYTMPSIKNVFKILTVHDLRTLTIGDHVWTQNIDHYKRALETCDMCVAVSECTKQDVIKYFGVDPAKIKVVYLGAHKRFRPLEPWPCEAIKAKYNLHEPFLLSIGSVARKNIEGIIRAFALSPANAKHQLVLGCYDNLTQYQQLARSLNIENKVRFLTALNDDDIVGLYNTCRCFVFPSFYEGFGLPILEAMQCGTAVITSDVSSCPEIAQGAAILVDPHNINEIAYAMDTICRDETYRWQLIEKGLQRARQFSWDNFAQEMEKIYALA